MILKDEDENCDQSSLKVGTRAEVSLSIRMPNKN